MFVITPSDIYAHSPTAFAPQPISPGVLLYAATLCAKLLEIPSGPLGVEGPGAQLGLRPHRREIWLMRRFIFNFIVWNIANLAAKHALGFPELTRVFNPKIRVECGFQRAAWSLQTLWMPLLSTCLQHTPGALTKVWARAPGDTLGPDDMSLDGRVAHFWATSRKLVREIQVSDFHLWMHHATCYLQ